MAEKKEEETPDSLCVDVVLHLVLCTCTRMQQLLHTGGGIIEIFFWKVGKNSTFEIFCNLHALKYNSVFPRAYLIEFSPKKTVHRTM